MNKERSVRRVIALGVGGVLVVTGACLSVDWPPTVESGFGGGHAAGSSGDSGSTTSPTGEGGTPAAGDSGDLGFSCSVGAPPAGGATCKTYASVPGATELASLMASCGGVIATGMGACPSTNIAGCCLSAPGLGYSEQTCWYSPATAAAATDAGCASSGGSFSVTPLTP